MGMLLVFVIALISGCGTSIKEQQKEAVKNVNEAFSNQPKATKKSTKHLKLYLPFGMAIQKDSPNNVIMKRGNQNYLLFYNQKVDKKGKEVYKISKPNKGILLDKNFTSKEKFGYLFVSKVKKIFMR